MTWIKGILLLFAIALAAVLTFAGLPVAAQVIPTIMALCASGEAFIQSIHALSPIQQLELVDFITSAADLALN